MWHRSLLFFWLLFSVLIFSSASLKAETNNWALIVDSSRYWFNYRHASNALSFYHILKERGIPDSQIILMLADDAACDSRNCMPSKIFNGMGGNLYDESIEVDYKGSEVNVLNLMRVITDRHEFGVPRSKRLMTNENSNLFVYFTGHGGDGFLKFQDQEELNSKDIADAFGQMYVQKRYNQILFLIDTCQASSMFEKLYSPNIVSIASSKVKESSYAYKYDSVLGIPIIDRFALHSLKYFESSSYSRTKFSSLRSFVNSLPYQFLHSHVQFNADLHERSLDEIDINEFVTGTTNFQTISAKKDFRILPFNLENN